MAKTAGYKLGEYATKWAMRYIVRQAIRPLIEKLLPTWKHKAIAATVLIIGCAAYGKLVGLI